MPGLNLRGIANRAIQGVNPNVLVEILRSTGYTTDDSGNRTPTFESIYASVQVQPVSYSDRAQLDGLNIQGVSRIVYLSAAVVGVIRIQQKGGDQIIFPLNLMPEDAPDPDTGLAPVWQITAVLEAYASGWRKCSCTLQSAPNS